ncbi:l-allo-threonine aldolase [Morchella snyderi]|nr:l-allo-threonine aldolase [Morchella snyderi]
MPAASTSSTSTPINPWTHSPATHDFRSDTLTTPTPTMLASLPTCSLGDDVYGESTTTTHLEARLAALFRKPAALFVLSGTMANQLCLRAHLSHPPHSVLCDARAHINVFEAGGLASLSQAMVQPVRPRNGLWLTLEDIQAAAVLSADIHYAPTRAVSLENTINGVIMPLSEMRRIGAWARAHGVRVHLDGARLWNACAVAGAPALWEYAAEVDSLAVSMSKGMGAPTGSVVLASEEVVARARHVRKAIGGGIRQAGVLTAMADAAIDEVWFGGKYEVGDAWAKRLEGKWKALGGEVSLPVETNMVWADLAGRGVAEEVWSACAEREGVRVGSGRIVCHFQNTIEAVEALERAMEAACQIADEKNEEQL